MDMTLELKDLLYIVALVVSAVSAYYMNNARQSQRDDELLALMTSMKEQLLSQVNTVQAGWTDALSRYQLEVLKTFVTRADLGERFGEIKAFLSSIDHKVDARLEKLDDRVAVIEKHRRHDDPL